MDASVPRVVVSAKVDKELIARKLGRVFNNSVITLRKTYLSREITMQMKCVLGGSGSPGPPLVAHVEIIRNRWLRKESVSDEKLMRFKLPIFAETGLLLPLDDGTASIIPDILKKTANVLHNGWFKIASELNEMPGWNHFFDDFQQSPSTGGLFKYSCTIHSVCQPLRKRTLDISSTFEGDGVFFTIKTLKDDTPLKFNLDNVSGLIDHIKSYCTTIQYFSARYNAHIQRLTALLERAELQRSANNV
jgi:hypothetical protein